MSLELRQHVSPELRLENIQRQLDDLQATQELLVNYMQIVAVSLGLKDKTKFLDERLEEIRSGVEADRRERDTVPP